jgi:hypothetical protein
MVGCQIGMKGARQIVVKLPELAMVGGRALQGASAFAGRGLGLFPGNNRFLACGRDKPRPQPRSVSPSFIEFDVPGTRNLEKPAFKVLEVNSQQCEFQLANREVHSGEDSRLWYCSGRCALVRCAAHALCSVFEGLNLLVYNAQLRFREARRRQQRSYSYDDLPDLFNSISSGNAGTDLLHLARFLDPGKTRIDLDANLFRRAAVDRQGIFVGVSRGLHFPHLLSLPRLLLHIL